MKAEWGLSDLQLRDMVNAGAVDLMEATVGRGRDPRRRTQVVDGRAVREANAKA